MKKYKRKIALISPKKFGLAAACVAIAIALIQWLFGRENESLVVGVGVIAALLVACFFLVLSVGHKYAYCDTSIRLFYFIIKYREIKYNDFNSICISNASYNNGYGYGVYGNIPMKFKSNGKTGINTSVYPFLTLHKSGYPIQVIKTTMNSRDLFMYDNRNIICLGICWSDSLMELLTYTDVPVYVLEDVYLRFRETFDTIFIKCENYINRVYIVTDHRVLYKKYLQGTN